MARYSDLDERVLTNVLNQQKPGSDRIYRQRARYPVIDVSADEFDAIMEKWQITKYMDQRHRSIYYSVEEIKKALRKLCLERGVRPKLNSDLLR